MAAIEAIRERVDAAGADRGFQMASHKFVDGGIELGVKPTGTTLIFKWHFVKIDAKDKTIGEIGREAADAFADWADLLLKPDYFEKLDHAKAH
jgi:hypothetical protein